jgi:hypothetical protein
MARWANFGLKLTKGARRNIFKNKKYYLCRKAEDDENHLLEGAGILLHRIKTAGPFRHGLSSPPSP